MNGIVLKCILNYCKETFAISYNLLHNKEQFPKYLCANNFQELKNCS